MKKCPYCSEEIQDDAIKCRYCGEMTSKKFSFDCEVLNEKGLTQYWKFEAYTQEAVEKHVSEKGWKLLTISKEGQPKQIIDQEYEKERRARETKRRKIGTLVFGLLLASIITYAAIVDINDNSESNSKVTKNSKSSSLHGTILENGYFGCTDRSDFDKLVKYQVQRDRVAFEKALMSNLLLGRCTTFNKDEEVIKTEIKLFSGTIKIRRKGETVEYWTFSEAV